MSILLFTLNFKQKMSLNCPVAHSIPAGEKWVSGYFSALPGFQAFPGYAGNVYHISYAQRCEVRVLILTSGGIAVHIYVM